MSTCNRVEVYAVVEELEVGYGRIQEFLADAHLSVSSEQLTPHLYWQTGDRAVAHLFRVAAASTRWWSVNRRSSDRSKMPSRWR